MYKLFKKVIEKKGSIPILQDILVKDGRAIATDMNIWLEVPAADIKDGVYHSDGIYQNIWLDSGYTAEDFLLKSDDAHGDILGEITLSADFILDAFAWVAIAQSTEETRYYLNGICFDGDKIVATDGHRIHIAELETPAPRNPKYEKGYVMPRKAVGVLIDAVKKAKPETVNLEIRGDGLVFKFAGIVLKTRLIDCTYPDWPRVLPGNVVGSTPFNPAEIKKLMPEIKALGKIAGRKTLGVKMNGSGELTFKSGGVTKTWPFSSKIEGFEIGFNALYLNDLCAGELYYQSPHDPIKIIGDKRTAALMPLRV